MNIPDYTLDINKAVRADSKMNPVSGKLHSINTCMTFDSFKAKCIDLGFSCQQNYGKWGEKLSKRFIFTEEQRIYIYVKWKKDILYIGDYKFLHNGSLQITKVHVNREIIDDDDTTLLLWFESEIQTYLIYRVLESFSDKQVQQVIEGYQCYLSEKASLYRKRAEDGLPVFECGMSL